MTPRKVVRAEASKIELAGAPSCVISATIHVFYSDGSIDERQVTFAPDGLMYEVFQEMVAGIAKLNQ